MTYLELKQKIESMSPEQQNCKVMVQLGWDRDFFNVEQCEFVDQQDYLPENYPYLTVLGAFPAVGLAGRFYQSLVNRFRR